LDDIAKIGITEKAEALAKKKKKKAVKELVKQEKEEEKERNKRYWASQNESGVGEEKTSEPKASTSMEDESEALNERLEPASKG
jgi:hypothetical protein